MNSPESDDDARLESATHRDIPKWYTDVLQAVLESDAEVTMEAHEDYGVDILVDGVSIVPGSEGFPWETFNLGRGWRAGLDEEQVDVLLEVLEDDG